MTMRLYPSRFFTPPDIAAPPAETVTEDKWHHNHAQPDRNQAVGKATRYLVAALAGFVLTPIDYPGTAGTGDALASTVTTSVRHDRTIVYEELAYSPYITEEVTLDKYARPFSEPTRRVVARQHQTVAFNPIPIPAWGWVPPFGTPRAAKRVAEFPAFAYAPYFVPAGAGTGVEFNWWPNLSERIRARVPVIQQQAVAFAGKPDDPPYWFPRLSEPTRGKVRPNQGTSFADSNYQVPAVVPGEPGDDTARPFTVSTSIRYDKTIIFDDLAWAPYPVEVVVETVTVDKWHAPLSQPTRRKTFREGSVAYSSTLIEDAAIEAKWFQPFGLPRAAKRPPEFPAYSYSPYFVPAIPGAGSEFNWWPNLSERLRQQRPVTQQQAVIQGPPTPFTVTLEYGWHRPLNEPTRRKREAQTAGAVFHPFPQITIAWQRPLTEPVWRKRNMGLYGSPPLIYIRQTGVGVGTDQPWPPLAEPVRFRLGLRHSQQQAIVWYPLVITSDLDPACRLLEPFDGGGTITAEGGEAVQVEAHTDLVAEDGEEALTPEPGKVLKVDC